MKRNLLLTMALLGLLVLAYTPAFAQAPDEGNFDDQESMMGAGPGHGMGMGMGMGMMGGGGERARKIADELQLTKDQKKQIEDITVNYRKDVITMRAQARVMNIDLQQMIRNDGKRADIDAKIDQIGKLRTDIQKKTVGMRLALRGVLTPDQREKWDNRATWMPSGPGQQMKDMIIKRFRDRGGRGQGL